MPENHHTFCIKFDPPKLGGILHEFDPIVLAGTIRRSTRDPVTQISSTIFDRSQGNLAPENRPSQEETCTPWKINMEHNHGGLEDHIPF